VINNADTSRSRHERPYYTCIRAETGTDQPVDRPLTTSPKPLTKAPMPTAAPTSTRAHWYPTHRSPPPTPARPKTPTSVAPLSWRSPVIVIAPTPTLALPTAPTPVPVLAPNLRFTHAVVNRRRGALSQQWHRHVYIDPPNEPHSAALNPVYAVLSQIVVAFTFAECNSYIVL
jgi:hypothetical protein